MSDYREVNRLMWDERASAHAGSPDYDVAAFAADPQFLSDVVRFDRPLLGDISGQRGVHLQCHIGTDTVSLARLGAQMTGLDFSGSALRHARALSTAAGVDAGFVQADVYAARAALDGDFDLVFTGIGALCWLPSITRWAGTVASLLRPGGRLFLREGHPVLWALGDPTEPGRIELSHPYLELPEPMVWDEQGTYVQSSAVFEHTVSHQWNHGIGQILTAVLAAGLRIDAFVEHDSIPWNAFPGHMDAVDGGEYRLSVQPERLPHSYTLIASRPAG